MGKIGDASYSLYLVHPFVLVPCAIILTKIGLSAYGYAFALLLGIGSILGGIGCYEFLEKPIGSVARKCVAKRITDKDMQQELGVAT